MRQTKKFVCAVAKTHDLAIDAEYGSQEELYALLNQKNYFWNSKKQDWLEGAKAQPPSSLTYVRVMTDYASVDHFADILTEALEGYGIELKDRSEPYACRPPKQNDSRIYLTFSDEKGDE